MSLILFLLLAAVFGGAGYYEARRHAKEFNHSPGGIPAGMWAAVCAVTLLIGMALLLVAARTDRGVGVETTADPFWDRDSTLQEYDDYHDLAEAPVEDPDVSAPVVEARPMKPLTSYPV
ncbi:MAG TPA: hypothetical protein VIC35_09205 [Acidimicrobiia bacterium]